MRPHVVLHNAVSVNGMLTGFDVNMGLYYDLAGRLGCQADLVGSGTIMAAPESAEADDPLETGGPVGGAGSLLVVADGRGRVKCWGFLQASGLWGDFASLACEATPPDHIEYLERRGVQVISAGEARVDLRAALETLGTRFGVTRVRTDSGGTLNAALLEAGLVDEISLLVTPVIAPAADETPLFGEEWVDTADVRLTHEERFDGGEVWLRYELGEARD